MACSYFALPTVCLSVAHRIGPPTFVFQQNRLDLVMKRPARPLLESLSSLRCERSAEALKEVEHLSSIDPHFDVFHPASFALLLTSYLSQLATLLGCCGKMEQTSGNSGPIPRNLETQSQSDSTPTGKKSPLEMISQGVCLPGIPLHPTFGEHRQWMLEKMALAFRVFARKGFADGLAGHISVRDPEWTHTFWTVSLFYPQTSATRVRTVC